MSSPSRNALLFALFSIIHASLLGAPCVADTARASNPKILVDRGIELERSRSWIEAIRHYESATRQFKDHAELRRRLLISRLHYDVVRRNSDASTADLVRQTSSAEALDLYSEVVARLEMSYVDRVQLAEIIRGGTAYLEVALTEPKFVDNFLGSADRQKLEEFRLNIHRVTLTQSVKSRFDARRVVELAAREAEKSIGLPANATIMQFVFGAVGLLDPYSSFLSSVELNEVESQIEGNFVGLGIALEPHSAPLKILEVISGGPADEAGLQADDLIVQIDGATCSAVGAEKAADMLRGPEKSQVRLVIQRAGHKDFGLNIARRRVEVPSVEDVELMDPTSGIGYLKINNFQKTTLSELDRALWKLHNEGMRSLIIDLRGNPGGWLDASVAVADRFLEGGVIVSTRGKSGIENQTYRARAAGTWKMPLSILIDDQSASASEILAGAIRDNQRGAVIGETSYGKGSVQGLFHTQTLSSGIRLTVSKFYSPSGRAISEQGVEPTLPVDEQVVFTSRNPREQGQAHHKKPDRVLNVALKEARTRSLTASK